MHYLQSCSLLAVQQNTCPRALTLSSCLRAEAVLCYWKDVLCRLLMSKQVFICCGKYKCFILSAGTTGSKRLLSDTPCSLCFPSQSLISALVALFISCSALSSFLSGKQNTRAVKTNMWLVPWAIKYCQIHFPDGFTPVHGSGAAVPLHLSGSLCWFCLGWMCCTVLPFLRPCLKVLLCLSSATLEI